MKFTQEDLKQLIKEEMAKLYEDAIEDSTAEEAAEGEQGRDELSTEHRCGSHGARDDDYVPDMECDCERCTSHREGSMARAQLARTSEIAMDLEKMIGEDTDLEEWVESKITKAKDYLSSVLDYMRGEDLVDAGDAARDMKAQAAAMNFGPMEEGAHDEDPFERLEDMDAEREQAMSGLYFDDEGNKIKIIGKRVTQGGKKVDYRVQRMGDGAEATVTFLPDPEGNLKKLKFGSFGPPKEKKPRQFGKIYKGAQMPGREGPPIRE